MLLAGPSLSLFLYSVTHFKFKHSKGGSRKRRRRRRSATSIHPHSPRHPHTQPLTIQLSNDCLTDEVPILSRSSTPHHLTSTSTLRNSLSPLIHRKLIPPTLLLCIIIFICLVLCCRGVVLLFYSLEIIPPICNLPLGLPSLPRMTLEGPPPNATSFSRSN